MTDDDGPLYSWWHVRHYCYTCGWVGRLPVIGYPIVRWHLQRVGRRLT